MTAAVQRWTRRVPQYTPPPDVDLTTMLARLREWQPFDGDALLDDVGSAMDECVPAEEQVEELAQRLRGHLMRLVAVAVASGQQDTATLWLIERARTLRSEDALGDHRKAVGHLRRMAWTVSELYEQLVATRCLREAA
ncbi:DUF6415 family natural product biosynthesis protein [Streptomyces sp. NPDC001621]|uniref:DUF6415 family natural product biosynthesis protein n=1 Tax=Streptomyces sp. NPDC001621 TaxID=3364594 RepID=UPI0036C52591